MEAKHALILIILAILIGGVLAFVRILPGITTLLWDGAYLGTGWVIWKGLLEQPIKVRFPINAPNFAVAFAIFWLVIYFWKIPIAWEYMNKLQGYPSTEDCVTEWDKMGGHTSCP